MAFDPNHGIPWRPSPDGQPRAHGRVDQEMLCSAIGPVLDLSGGGARVLSRRRRSGFIFLKLYDSQRHVVVKSRVVWSRRVGFMRYELGVQFLFITPRQAEALTALCRDNRARRSVMAG